MPTAPRAARALVGATVVLLGLAVAPLPEAAAQPIDGPPIDGPVFSAPHSDPFYADPPDLANRANGDIIRSRTMPRPTGVMDVETWQLAFRSTNAQGRPITAVTTILAPHNRPVDGPVLSYQQITNALGLRCSPSRALWTTESDVITRELPAYNAALANGWTLVIPDHLGPNSAYAVGPVGGHITLDGIRAVQRFEPLRLGAGPVALAGYSGGAIATGFAASYAADYAPELPIIGYAIGGTPANITRMALSLGADTPHPAFGLAFAAAVALEREYPDRFPLSEYLNADGARLRQDISNACTVGILARGAGLSARSVTTGNGYLTDPRPTAITDEISLEYQPGIPNAPIYEWHSPGDVLIPLDAIDRTIARYCAAGVPVTSGRVDTPDHLTAAVLGLPGAIDWISDRFAGLPPPPGC